MQFIISLISFAGAYLCYLAATTDDKPFAWLGVIVFVGLGVAAMIHTPPPSNGTPLDKFKIY